MAKQKGDILVRRDNDYVEEMSIGDDRQVLTVDLTDPKGFAFNLPNTITAVASGDIDIGSTTMLNIDGTISQLARPPQTFAKFDSGHSLDGGCETTLIAGTNKFVSIYQKNPSLDVAVVVGTINGDDIIYGTETSFNVGDTVNAAITVKYIKEQDRLFVYWILGSTEDLSHYYYYATGSVVEGATPDLDYTTWSDITSGGHAYTSSGIRIASTYDEINDRLVLTTVIGSYFASNVYQIIAGDTLNDDVVTKGASDLIASIFVAEPQVIHASTAGKIIALISITYSNDSLIVGDLNPITNSITWGNRQFVPTLYEKLSHGIAYDSYNNVVLVIDKRYAQFGTVEQDNTITWGTRFYIGTSDNTRGDVSIAYDTLHSEFILSYRTSVNYVQSVLGLKVLPDGTMTTTTTIQTLDSTTCTAEGGNCLYCPIEKRTIIVYNALPVDRLIAFVYNSGQTNLDSNFLGIAQNSVLNGQSSTIAILGAVDKNQTNLVRNTSYFADGGGGLVTDSVRDGVQFPYVGDAISDTDILMKGDMDAIRNILFDTNSNLEDAIQINIENIENNYTDIKQLESYTSSLSADLSDNYTEHVSLSGAIDSNSTDITSLSGAIKVPTYGSIWFSDNTNTMTVTGAGIWATVEDFNMTGVTSNTTPSTASNIITIDTDGDYQIICPLTFKGDSDGDVYIFKVFKNGATALDNCNAKQKTSNTDEHSTSISGQVTLTQNDTLELMITTEIGSSVMTMVNANLQVTKLDN